MPSVNDSILLSIKRPLGLSEDIIDFDNDIIMHINSVLAGLVQMGIGPTDGFVITGENEVWTDFVGSTRKIEQVKSYVYAKVRLLFDPPTNSSLIESLNKMANEFEWRMYIEKGNY